jgi:hypothetical protein
MTAEATRTLKEARALLFPWCAMMILCTFPLFSSRGQFLNFLFQTGLLIGVPLLACLSFGNEFRYKTMELLVSQPVSRLKIWREKWIVVVVAILTTTLVASLCSRTPLRVSRPEDLDYVMFLVITTFSAAFWTLFARSTLGGIMLNIAIVIPLSLVKFGFWEWNSIARRFSDTGVILVLSVAALGYSAFMLWLGRWMLVRRQSGAGLAGSDLMVAIPTLMPRPIAGLLQCRRDQAVLNLIRKEVHLLRPLWLLSALYVLGWSAIAISSSLISPVGYGHQAMLVILVVGSASYPVIAIFLGATLPFAEEGAFGIQLWHLTLPLSVKTQWLTRLVTGLLAGLVCGVGLFSVLMALTHALPGPDIVQEMVRMSLPIPTAYLLMFFVFIFWCAVIARDLPRTAVLAVAASALLSIAYGGGQQIGIWILEILDKVATLVVALFQLNPYFFREILRRMPDLPHMPESLIIVVTYVAMGLHSYLLFRRLPVESTFRMLRPLVPYLILAFALTFYSAFRRWDISTATSFTLAGDTERAIARLHPTNAFTVEDLSKVSTLPARTARWLRNSTMNATISDPDLVNGYLRLLPPGAWKVYDVTIRLSSGTTCRMSFPFQRDKPQEFWFTQPRCD